MTSGPGGTALERLGPPWTSARPQPGLACQGLVRAPACISSPPLAGTCKLQSVLGEGHPKASCPAPRLLPRRKTSCYGMCQCLSVHHNTLTSFLLFLPFLLTNIKASPGSLPCTEGLVRGVLSSQGFSRRDLLRGIPVACWRVGSPASAGPQGPLEDQGCTLPPAGSGIARQ